MTIKSARTDAVRVGQIMSAKGREGSRLLSSQPGSLYGLILCGGLLLLGSLCGCGVGDRLLQAQPAEKSDAKTTANRLARETSPYLLLHAHNPVDWYPWGPEAFAKAKRENKLIFLSIGYSSCFWCHVMEREVFSNPAIAAFMNEHFVNIKVDREERPDVDEIYMTSLQVYYQLSGVRSAGGWPLSMFLTPDLLPLAGGTYFPPEDTEDRTGFRSILKTIDTAWNERPTELKETADTLTDAVRSTLRQRPVLTPVKLEPALLQQVVTELQRGFDSEFGGFDYNPDQPQRPKFPTPVRLAFLQSYAAQQQDEDLQKQILLTLDRMANGGIHDQLGGGFHRYSTDRFWRVPHFEKMLYDNAQLVGVYLTAYEQTQEPRYRQVAEGIIGFVLRELTDKSGAFYSALDAETDGVEGEYYVWTRDEIQQALSAEDVRLLALHHGLDQPPNFEEKYVLEVIRTPDELAKELNLPVEELQPRLRQAQAALWKVRHKRKPLLRDDKLLVAWNGLMIQSLARAGRVLQNDDYTTAAERAALFLLEHLRDQMGDLLHSYCAGEAKLPAYVDDYALLISGLLELQTTTGDEKWLAAAVRLQAKQDELFWDDRGQGYFHAAVAHEQPIIRTQQVADLIMPSGNSASARNLLQLAVLADQPPLRERAAVLLKSGAPRLLNSARSSATLAAALQEYLAAEPAASEKTGDEAPKADEEQPNENSGIDSDTPDSTSELATEQNPILQAGAEEPAAPAEPAPKDTPAIEKKKPQHVTGHVYLPYEKLPAGKSSDVLIRLEILEGWHINPNPAPDEFTLPTDVTLKSQLDIELADLVFPKPKKKEVAGLKKTLLYYEGRTLIRGQLVVPAEAAGKTAELELKVKYQACNDDVCLTPKTLTIKVPVTIVRPGEPLKPINEKLFPKG